MFEISLAVSPAVEVDLTPNQLSGHYLGIKRRLILKLFVEFWVDIQVLMDTVIKN